MKSAEVRYYPWGTERYTSGTTPTTYKFTGQRNENGLGLYFYNSRWYDGSLACFIQGDSIVPGQGNNSEASKHISIWLIVDYHELNLLSLLGEMHRKDLFNPPNDDSKQGDHADGLDFNPTRSNQQEQDTQQDNGMLDNIVQPLVDFNQPSNLGRQQYSGSQDVGKKNNKNNPIVGMPIHLDAMGLDRYAYTSNCPTKYTDPSGHCNLTEMLSGISIIAIKCHLSLWRWSAYPAHHS